MESRLCLLFHEVSYAPSFISRYYRKNEAISQRDGLEFSSVLSEKVRQSDHLSRPLSVFRKSLAR